MLTERLFNFLIWIPVIFGQGQVQLEVFQDIIQIGGSSCNCTEEIKKSEEQVEKKMEDLNNQNKNLQEKFNNLQLKLDRLQERSDGHEACFEDLGSDNCTGSKSGLIGIVEAIRVDGRWGTFSDWSQCSVSCGGGVQVRNRTCDNPAPENGGRQCIGAADEQRACNARQCDVVPNGYSVQKGDCTGNDIWSIFRQVATLEECSQLCNSTPRCKAFMMYNQTTCYPKTISCSNPDEKNPLNVFYSKIGVTDGGCYEDDYSRLLDYEINSATNTPEECKKACASRGYYYAGIHVFVCYCGNDEPPSSRIRESSECDVKCHGDATFTCGGANWRMNIYKTDKHGLHDGTKSSSTYFGDLQTWGSKYATDGLISTGQTLFFHSARENYPWLQIELSAPTQVSRVTLVNRKDDCCFDRLKNAEIRAGMEQVPEGTTNQLLTINNVCAKFEGPASSTEDINLTCETPVIAKFLTIQLKDRNSYLQINEVEINGENGAGNSRGRSGDI